MSNEPETQKASLLARVNFPIYCVKAISERHILIGGGGGISKTGISNPFEIYELTYDPVTNTARATLATHFDVGAEAIMNMCLIPKSKYTFEVLCGGMKGMCHVYDVRFAIRSGGYSDSRSETPDDQPHPNHLRRRHFSLSSQHSSDIEENIEEVVDHQQKPTGVTSTAAATAAGSAKSNGGDDNGDNKGDNGKKTSLANGQNIPDYGFEFELRESFQTDFHSNEPYQKLIKYSPNANMVFSAGSDGHIGFWDWPHYRSLARIRAHQNEIDDIDIHPAGCHLCSVSRDGRGMIWDIMKQKLVCSLEHTDAIPKPGKQATKEMAMAPVKYNPRLCRYGTVEGDDNNVRLFVALNTRSKLDSYICKWFVKNDRYIIEKMVSAGNVPLFAMAVSDDGRFLAVGKQTGDVDVFIAFSLQKCYHFSQAHNIFVTALEFLPTTPATLELAGGQIDAALVSVSVDNRIVLHRIPKRPTLGFFGSLLFFVLFILFIYVAMNYFDL